MSDLNTDLNEIQDEQAIVPAGVYEARIASIDFATEQGTDERRVDKNGEEYLQASFRITAGDHEGRHVFLNYLNPTKSTFKKMCEKGGLQGVIQTTEELVGLMVMVKVEVELYKGEERNKVKGFA